MSGRVGTGAVLGGAAVLAVLGLVTGLGPLVGGAAVLLLGAGAVCAAGDVAWPQAPAPVPARAVPVRPAAPFVEAPVLDHDVAAAALLTGEELCHAWRGSFPQLLGVTGPEWTDQVARQRRIYLDELERRDPVAFAAWIGAGARASSDPGRALRATRPTGGRQQDAS